MVIINAFSKFHKAFLDARACRLLGTAQPLGDRLPIAQDAGHMASSADEHQAQHHNELGMGNRSGNSKVRARLDDARDRLIVMTSHHTRAQTKPRAAPSARRLRIGV